MSDITTEEKNAKLLQNFISGEELPDIYQSFNLLDSIIKNVIKTDVLEAGDIILAVRSLDSFRQHLVELKNDEEINDTIIEEE